MLKGWPSADIVALLRRGVALWVVGRLRLYRGGDDQNVYLVVSDFGRHGLAWCETDVEATDLETIISDLLDGQYTTPVRVVGFNVAERWARDVSEDATRPRPAATHAPLGLTILVSRNRNSLRGRAGIRVGIPALPPQGIIAACACDLAQSGVGRCSFRSASVQAFRTTSLAILFMWSTRTTLRWICSSEKLNWYAHCGSA
jgi:hypothetical protein